MTACNILCHNQLTVSGQGQSVQTNRQAGRMWINVLTAGEIFSLSMGIWLVWGGRGRGGAQMWEHSSLQKGKLWLHNGKDVFSLPPPAHPGPKWWCFVSSKVGMCRYENFIVWLSWLEWSKFYSIYSVIIKICWKSSNSKTGKTYCNYFTTCFALGRGRGSLTEHLSFLNVL